MPRMEGRQYDPDSDSLSFPTDTVAGILDDPDAADATLDQLVAAGVPQDRIQVLCCDEGARRLDPSGKRHGFVGRLHRTIQLFADKEVAHVKHQSDELRQGKFLVAAPAEGDEKERIAQILQDNGGHFINHYGKWTVERLDSTPPE